ncbi:MAG TPA: ABC transporter permease, partial [Lachnospiraceae bacterium]|nr:ABC transporter permease [Lachnospiraceae bacterium]
MEITMVKYEIKKVFSKTGSKIAVLLLLLTMGIICFFALSVSYVDEKGESRNGPAAVCALKAAQKEWAGYLNEETIRKVIATNRRIRNTPEALSQNVTQKNIAYSWGQGIAEIRSLLNCSYAKGFREYDYYRADSLAEDDAVYFYTNRTKLLREWLQNEAKGQFSAQEKEYLIRQYGNLNTPFYYDYMAGWQQLFEFSPTIIMLTMLILGYLVSGIFSNEFTWKSDAIFFSSVYGRNKGTA